MSASEYVAKMEKIADNLDRLGHLTSQERRWLEDASKRCTSLVGEKECWVKADGLLSPSYFHSKDCEKTRAYARYILNQAKVIESWNVSSFSEASQEEKLLIDTSVLDTFKF